MRKYRICCLAVAMLASTLSRAQTADELFASLRTKILQVTDYEARVNMKIDVTYMRVPLLKGTLYFKAPDKMKLERNGGVSILPRKNVKLTLSNLIPTGKVTIIDMGAAAYNGKKVRILKVVPDDEKSTIVLTKIWVDEARLLVVHAETTTYSDGSVVMDLDYDKYAAYALPDRIKIFMDLKDYKLPKSVTMDYDNATPTPPDPKQDKPKKGTIEIKYLDYKINQGLPDSRFE